MKNTAKQFSKQGGRTRGFTLLEVLVVLAVTAILMAIAIPQFQRITQVLRISGDMRDITGTVGQAKMHAAADFTHARARANLVANTFQLEIWNKAGNGGAEMLRGLCELTTAKMPAARVEARLIASGSIVPKPRNFSPARRNGNRMEELGAAASPGTSP